MSVRTQPVEDNEPHFPRTARCAIWRALRLSPKEQNAPASDPDKDGSEAARLPATVRGHVGQPIRPTRKPRR